MPLFICDECGTVDNTATSGFYRQTLHKRPPYTFLLCSACDPEIGVWHDKFPRMQWDREMGVVNPPASEA